MYTYALQYNMNITTFNFVCRLSTVRPSFRTTNLCCSTNDTRNASLVYNENGDGAVVVSIFSSGVVLKTSPTAPLVCMYIGIVCINYIIRLYLIQYINTYVVCVYIILYILRKYGFSTLFVSCECGSIIFARASSQRIKCIVYIL